jgi:hypothetical protein
MSASTFRFCRKLTLALVASITVVGSGLADAQPATTRMLVTVSRLKPDRVDEWLSLQAREVVPALKRAGVSTRVVYETVIGERAEFVSVRPLPSFAEFNGPAPLERALGAEKAEQLIAKLRDCLVSEHRRIETRRDDFFLDPGDARALFASRYRATPGRSADYMEFIRTEMFPVMQEAQENGTFAGLSVTVSGQGGEAGLITLNMHYEDFAPLDGPPPIAKTLGPAGTREFLVKGAGLITPIEQLVLRRLDELSF